GFTRAAGPSGIAERPCASPPRKLRSPRSLPDKFRTGGADRHWDSIAVLICQIPALNARLGRGKAAFSLPIVAAKESSPQQEEHGCGRKRNGVAEPSPSRGG